MESTKVSLFGSETIHIYCNASGRPLPKVKWTFNSREIVTLPNYILKIENARQNESGLYVCIAENEYGNDSKAVDVIVKDEFPGLPSLVLVNRSEDSLEVEGEKPSYTGRGNAIKYFKLQCAAALLYLQINESVGFKRKISNLNSSTTYDLSLTACNAFVCSDTLITSFTTSEPGKSFSIFMFNELNHIHLFMVSCT